MDRLKSIDVWNDIYDIFLVNAEGNGNIPARYQDRYQNGSYEVVLVFCDTEKKPYEQNDHIDGSSNFVKLLELLETGDYRWIYVVNEKLDD